MTSVAFTADGHGIECPECGAGLVVNWVARVAECPECDLRVRPATHRKAVPQSVQGPVANIVTTCLTGAFLGVLAVPVYVALKALPVVFSAYQSPHGLTFDEAWRFLALVELIEGVPSIPGWAVAGALVGLVLAILPDSTWAGAGRYFAGSACGALAGYLCGITWYERAPVLEMICIGATLGMATSAMLAWRRS